MARRGDLFTIWPEWDRGADRRATSALRSELYVGNYAARVRDLVRRRVQDPIAGEAIARDAADLIRQGPGIAKDEEGKPLVSAELLVISELPRPGQKTGSNVTLRGLEPNGLKLRPQVKIVEGRMSSWYAERVLPEQGVFGDKETVQERLGGGQIVRFAQAFIGD